jgi:hypothetical protein
MDEEMINQIEDNVEDLPDEVKDFIFGVDFETISQELVSLLNNETEKKDLPSEVMLFLFGVRTKEELISYISTQTTSDENKQKIKVIIDEKIIDELILLIDVYKDFDKELEKEDENVEVKTIPSKLSSLSDRLKQASITTPAKRDYSLNRPSVGNSVVDNLSDAPSPTSHTIDPYHEPVDNE